MESRRNGPQLSSRHDDDDDDTISSKLTKMRQLLLIYIDLDGV